MRVELTEKGYIVIGGTKEEAVVHMTLLCCQCKLLFKRFDGCGLWHRVRHVEIGGDATCCRCPTLAVDISLSC